MVRKFSNQTSKGPSGPFFITMNMNKKMNELLQSLDRAEAPTNTPVENADVKRIYNYCVHLIARQDYSEYKLRQKLRSKPQNLPHDIDEAIEKLKTKGLLREASYRRLFIRKWMIKGESADKIKKRGAMEKLSFEEEEFEEAARELGLNDEDNLERLIQKKLRSKEIPTNPEEKYKLRDKVLRFLISKGHSYDEAKKGLANYFNK